jgi:hypothetical protein
MEQTQNWLQVMQNINAPQAAAHLAATSPIDSVQFQQALEMAPKPGYDPLQGNAAIYPDQQNQPGSMGNQLATPGAGAKAPNVGLMQMGLAAMKPPVATPAHPVMNGSNHMATNIFKTPTQVQPTALGGFGQFMPGAR